jgi:DNA-directed RNA polymerase subunit RPC12/RpoP
MAKWSGLACPDCGCKRMVAYCTRRIAGGNLRVRACGECGRRVHTIESITSVRTYRGGTRPKKAAGSPARPG